MHFYPMRNQFSFLLGEAFRGLRADRFLAFTSIVTIGVCSTILSFLLVALALVFSLDTLGNLSDAPLRAFTKSQYEDSASIASLKLKLEKLDSFDSIVFVSKDDALMEFRHDFGDEMVQYLETNPLPYSFKLYPSEKPLTAGRVRTLQSTISEFGEVEEVTSNIAVLEWLERWKLPVQTGSMLLLAFMAGALALVVHNAVKLSLYARRALVENMKYCGASESFILAPFVLEGMLLGLFGSLFGVATLWVLTRLIDTLFPSLPAHASFFHLSLYLVGGAILLALFSSWNTVRTFFRGNPA